MVPLMWLWWVVMWWVSKGWYGVAFGTTKALYFAPGRGLTPAPALWALPKSNSQHQRRQPSPRMCTPDVFCTFFFCQTLASIRHYYMRIYLARVLLHIDPRMPVEWQDKNFVYHLAVVEKVFFGTFCMDAFIYIPFVSDRHDVCIRIIRRCTPSNRIEQNRFSSGIVEMFLLGVTS